MDKVIHSKEIAQERVEWGKRYTYFKKNLLLVEESFLQCEEESLVEEAYLPPLQNASPPSSYIQDGEVWEREQPSMEKSYT